MVVAIVVHIQIAGFARPFPGQTKGELAQVAEFFHQQRRLAGAHGINGVVSLAHQQALFRQIRNGLDHPTRRVRFRHRLHGPFARCRRLRPISQRVTAHTHVGGGRLRRTEETKRARLNGSADFQGNGCTAAGQHFTRQQQCSSHGMEGAEGIEKQTVASFEKNRQNSGAAAFGQPRGCGQPRRIDNAFAALPMGYRSGRKKADRSALLQMRSGQPQRSHIALGGVRRKHIQR